MAMDMTSMAQHRRMHVISLAREIHLKYVVDHCEILSIGVGILVILLQYIPEDFNVHSTM